MKFGALVFQLYLPEKVYFTQADTHILKIVNPCSRHFKECKFVNIVSLNIFRKKKKLSHVKNKSHSKLASNATQRKKIIANPMLILINAERKQQLNTSDTILC